MEKDSISSALKAVSFSGMQMDLFIEPGICLNSDGSGALDRTHHPWDQELVGGLGLSEFWEPLRWHRRPQNYEGTASALNMLHERSFPLLRPSLRLVKWRKFRVHPWLLRVSGSLHSHRMNRISFHCGGLSWILPACKTRPPMVLAAQ